MSCLVLALTGPAQSWGLAARFALRDTGFEPSKSGVVGLLAAAMGHHRHDDIADLAALRMGVRVDHEGSVVRDYHTALGPVRANRRGNPDAVVSNRYYLADAAFLVALESKDEDLLGNLDQALAAPRWPLFLGRKSFPPAGPLGRGVVAGELDQILGTHALIDPSTHRHCQLSERLEVGEKIRLRTVVEVTPSEATASRHDQPVSFDARRFAPRPVRTGLVELKAEMLRQSVGS
jgi:CRISPR system Cascade subunit CasD